MSNNIRISMILNWGDSLEFMFGHDLILGNPEENDAFNNMPGRDAFIFSLSWCLM